MFLQKYKFERLIHYYFGRLQYFTIFMVTDSSPIQKIFKHKIHKFMNI